MYKAKHAKARQNITATVLLFTMLFSIVSGIFPLPWDTAEAEDSIAPYNITEEYHISDGNIALSQYDKVQVYADSNKDAYQWQIMVADDFWVNIQGETAPIIQVGCALLANVLDVNDMAFIRCAYGDDVYSDVLAVQVEYVELPTQEDEGILYEEVFDDELTVEENLYEQESPRLFSLRANSSSPSVNSESSMPSTYDIIVRYMLDGKIIHPAWTATISSDAKSEFFPAIQGYEPTVETILLPDGVTVGTETEDETTGMRATFDYDQMTGDAVVTVHYQPINVPYTIHFYQQNILNDGYTKVAEETHYGETASEALHHTEIQNYINTKYNGFTVLTYTKNAKIAADGSTEVEVYYDRNYYLMTFDLDGGYGVEPVYTRYEASIGPFCDPVKAGYTFAHWHKKNTETELQTANLPSTMPNENVTYEAHWVANQSTKVTIVIWGESESSPTGAENKVYDYVKSIETHAKPGVQFSWETACGLEAHTHTSECVGCGLVEHEHSADDLQCTKPVHTHGISCYDGVISNTVSSSSLPGNAVNGQIATYRSIIWDRKAIYINGQWYRYNGTVSSGNIAPVNCGLTEHIHSIANDCYKECLIPAHTHSDSCYKCDKQEHTHDASCTYDQDVMESELWTYVPSDTVTVAEDGSSVLNVYYDRQTFTLSFYDDNNLVYTINEKWGANIQSHWPIKGTNGVTYNNGERWDPSGSKTYSDVLAYIAVMPAESFRLNLDESNNDSYTMHYCVEYLPSELTDDIKNTIDGKLKYDEKYFKEEFKVTANYNYLTYEEDFLNLEGYIRLGSNPSFSNNQIDINGGGDVYFYYTREPYNLEYNNGFSIVKTVPIPYGTDLTAYNWQPIEAELAAIYPTAYPPGAYTFAGWYKDKACTAEHGFTWNTTMPAENVIVYAKWEKANMTINFYQDASLTNKLSSGTAEYGEIYGNDADEDIPTPENNGMKFVGWFYKDGETEKAFDFDNMAVLKSMNVYAKWSSNVSVDYIIHYVVKNYIGPDTIIAKSETGSALAGTTLTFTAKTGDSLYEGYREGYFPTLVSHSITLDASNLANNTFTFEYTAKSDVNYIVQYRIKTVDGNGTVTISKFPDDKKDVDGNVIEDKTKTTKKAIVTEIFKTIPGYAPDAYQKQLIIEADNTSHNVITFYYTVNTAQAYYKETHYIESIDKGVYEVYQSVQELKNISAEPLSATPKTINGFTYNHAWVTQDGVRTQITDKDAPISGVLTNKGLHLELYYTRNNYPYTVRYLDSTKYNSENPSTIETAKLHEPRTGDAPYGWLLSVHAVAIDGYDAVSDYIDLRIDIPSETKKNIVTFLYSEQNATIQYMVAGNAGASTVKLNVGEEEGTLIDENVLVFSGDAPGGVSGAIPQPAEEYRFVGWYKDEACAKPVPANWVDANTKLLTPKKV